MKGLTKRREREERIESSESAVCSSRAFGIFSDHTNPVWICQRLLTSHNNFFLRYAQPRGKRQVLYVIMRQVSVHFLHCCFHIVMFEPSHRVTSRVDIQLAFNVTDLTPSLKRVQTLIQMTRPSFSSPFLLLDSSSPVHVIPSNSISQVKSLVKCSVYGATEVQIVSSLESHGLKD